MLIHEAITKAGPGGKIRRETSHKSVPSWIVPEEEVGNLIRENNEDRLLDMSCVLLLTATDWEVVEPEPVIEVGDEVVFTSDNSWTKYEVVKIDKGEQTYLREVAPQVVTRPNRLTLIHKGPKGGKICMIADKCACLEEPK
jgi:hypothetical protein